tara:strand:- start:12525 stop:13436 length:912 start_codon:yes stop_codon:yes gene_type:complete
MNKLSPNKSHGYRNKTLDQHKLKVSVLSFVAYGTAIIGVILIIVSAFYIYSKSRSGLDAAEFTYSIPDHALHRHMGISAPKNKSISVTNGKEPIPLQIEPQKIRNLESIYPGNQLNPKYWSEPEWAGSDPYGGPTIPAEFTTVRSTDLFIDPNPSTHATRIRIPSIAVDSEVRQLQIIDIGDQKSYETPNNVVGHIPETSLPGQQGDGWFFGHLESFTAQEGKIFRRLPEITELIKQDPVDIFLETSNAEYIYRVTRTSQVQASDLYVTNTRDAQITLVTCWPPLVYDQRVVIDATLIAYRPI